MKPDTKPDRCPSCLEVVEWKKRNEDWVKLNPDGTVHLCRAKEIE